MLTINILPQELKREAKERRIYYLIKIITFVISITLTIITIMFIAVNIALENTAKKNLTNEQTIKNTKTEYASKIKNLNTKILDISNIQKEFFLWSEILITISSSTPSNITFKKLKMDSSSKTIKISGTANTRDDLLQFKNNLEKLNYLQNLNFPIKNILEKENINFEIIADIDLEKLKYE